MEEDYLYVDTSTLHDAGKGLFTKKFLKKGVVIGYFTGKIINEAQAGELSTGERGRYFIELTSGKILDTYNSKSPARWANDARDKKVNNCKLYSTDDGAGAYLWSTKNISAGGEIFVDYGAQYWKQIDAEAKK